MNQGHFGFAVRVKEGHYDRVVFQPDEGFRADDVKFGDDEVLVTAERARELIQPPHLARVEIRPTARRVRHGEAVPFAVAGFDQHDKPFPCPSAAWSATGGRITPDGVFTSESRGTYTVRAIAGEQQASAMVEVAEGGPPPPPPPPPLKGFAWSSAIPTQKWMTLCTKVLSRFANVPGFKVEVSFQVPPGQEGDEAKVEEARAALRELGLSEDHGSQ